MEFLGRAGRWFFLWAFFRQSSGLEEFRTLAESAWLTLCEFNQHIDPNEGHNGWMGFICTQGQYSPSPLLRRKGCPPKLFFFDDKADGIACDPSWWVDDDGDPLSADPIYFELAHDVFVSSIAIIRSLLEPESVLLIGETIGYSPSDQPMFEAFQEEVSSDEDVKCEEEKKTDQPNDTPFDALNSMERPGT